MFSLPDLERLKKSFQGVSCLQMPRISGYSCSVNENDHMRNDLLHIVQDAISVDVMMVEEFNPICLVFFH